MKKLFIILILLNTLHSKDFGWTPKIDFNIQETEGAHLIRMIMPFSSKIDLYNIVLNTSGVFNLSHPMLKILINQKSKENDSKFTFDIPKNKKITYYIDNIIWKTVPLKYLKREGLGKTYAYISEKKYLISVVPYKDDMINGTVYLYDLNGDITDKATFENNIPIGTAYLNNKTVTFIDGLAVSGKILNEHGKLIRAMTVADFENSNIPYNENLINRSVKNGIELIPLN